MSDRHRAPVMCDDSDRYRAPVMCDDSDRNRAPAITMKVTVTDVLIAQTTGKLTVQHYQELNINEVVNAVTSGTDTE
jgi:hypothetical protein